MKNKAGIWVIIFCVFLSIAAFDAGAQEGLRVWSFTDEVGNMIDNYYLKDNPRSRIEYTLIPTEQFPSRLDPVLASGRGAPDVFALEAAFVRKYVESGLLLDLTDIYERNKSKLLAYPVEIGTYNGRVYAMSWQACPGAMFYRRSLAKKYLGTDDPAIVQTYFSNFNKFMETAELLKNRSNGACVTVASRGDLYKVFLGSRTQPWVVNDTLTIDPNMDSFMDMSKVIHDSRYDARVGQWSEGWFAGMRGELRDGNGGQIEVFSYFLPTWGLHYVLKPNVGVSSSSCTSCSCSDGADWAMIPGPASYHWGGTWIGAWKNTQNADAAKRFIEYIVANDNFLERWASDTGDMVSNINVVNRIKGRYSEPFLGGQNHYAAFADIALTVNAKTAQRRDEYIEDRFIGAVNDFVDGRKTKAQALADFREQVNEYWNR